MSDALVTTHDDGALTLRINRPQRENRLNLEVLVKLGDALEAADGDAEVRALVITGTGATFCCGGDIDAFARGDADAYREFGKHFARVHLGIARSRKPVLAAVNGDARAGGMSLMSICDLALSRQSARFAMPEIRDGLWPMMAMVALHRVLPRKRAFELYYFGESFDSAEATALGLINWTAPDAAFDGAVRERTRQLCSLSQAAVSIGRPAFDESAAGSLEHGYDLTADRLVELLSDPEVAAALAARRERR